MTFASRTTFPHFATSFSISARNASCDDPTGSAPSVAHIAFSSGSANALTTASLSFCTTAAGAPAGTQSPYHDVTSKPARPDSIAAGTSGNAGERLADVTTMGRMVPARIWPAALPSASKMQSASPATSACVAGPVPL